jgi:hypothetical protein
MIWKEPTDKTLHEDPRHMGNFPYAKFSRASLKDVSMNECQLHLLNKFGQGLPVVSLR